MNSKTPISYLHQLCLKKGYTPQYNLIGQEGRTHEPLFIFNCHVADLVSNGQGTSKKKARHKAAQNMLILISNLENLEHPLIDLKKDISEIVKECEQLLSDKAISNESLNLIANENIDNKDNNVENVENSDKKTSTDIHLTNGEIPQNTDESLSSKVNNSNNPIGELLEICLTNHIPPPTYDMVDAHGMAHERVFVIEAKVDKYSAKGEAKSKKMAKRLSAIKLLTIVKKEMVDILVTDPIASKPDVKVVDGVDGNTLNKDSVENENAGKNGTNKSFPVTGLNLPQDNIEQVYLEFREPKESLLKLKSMDIPNPEDEEAIATVDMQQMKSLLKSIAYEQGFSIEYTHHYNKNNDKFPHIAYLQLTTTPIICTAALGKSSRTQAYDASVLDTLRSIQLTLSSREAWDSLYKSTLEKSLPHDNLNELKDETTEWWNTTTFPEIFEIPLEGIINTKDADEKTTEQSEANRHLAENQDWFFQDTFMQKFRPHHKKSKKDALSDYFLDFDQNGMDCQITNLITDIGHSLDTPIKPNDRQTETRKINA
ncbi:unnamed protein product [Gordionus sp. m RMFG-2023]|uniref:RISC-loading complex subunit tarbp2-like isoform X2 n=1 Tax=Gordionus sp. m RMFG-2023 TaxID=3053472 RepID=UPI0030E33DAC